MRLTRDQWAMEMAKLTALRSTCFRRRVGCVLLNARGHVLATGYNGVAVGLPHCNDVRPGARLASVKENPRPGRWQETGAFYLERAREDHPDLAVLQGPLLNPRLDKSTVEGHVALVADLLPHACSGAMSLSGTNLDACQAIHAEQNAMLQCRDVYAIHTAFVTASPCMTCVKLLLNTSCERVVYLEEYPHSAAKDLWLGAGRAWDKYREAP